MGVEYKFDRMKFKYLKSLNLSQQQYYKLNKPNLLSQKNQMEKKEFYSYSNLMNEEIARKLCFSIINNIRDLLTKNDISLNEIKLILAIIEPRSKSKTTLIKKEDARISIDDIVSTFIDVVAGNIPRNKIALNMLAKEMETWASIKSDNTNNNNPKVTTNYLRADSEKTETREGDQFTSYNSSGLNKNPLEILSGYYTIYTITSIPLIFTITVIVILFFSSLK